MSNTQEQEQGYICPRTNLQCDDECCVNPMDCHIKAGEKVFLSNNKQSSSIDFFWNQLPEILPFTVDTETAVKLWGAFEQAKAMHKEEIVKAYNQSWHLRDKPYETADKYYNETFGGSHE